MKTFPKCDLCPSAKLLYKNVFSIARAKNHFHTLLRLVFTSDEVGVGRKSAYDLVKIKNRIRRRRHKRDGIGVRRIRAFPFLPTPLTTLSLTPR